MKDIGVDRRTLHSGDIDSSVKSFSPVTNLAFNLIERGQPFMGPFSTISRFNTEQTEGVNSKKDIEVRDLLKQLSLEEKVSYSPVFV
jgi:hypothetical protein